MNKQRILQECQKKCWTIEHVKHIKREYKIWKESKKLGLGSVLGSGKSLQQAFDNAVYFCKCLDK